MSDTAPASDQPLSVGKFRLIASLGQGGMADVYLAVASGVGGFNKLQVLKRLRPDRAEEQGIVEMFLDEARLAAQLNHPNVVSTLEVCEDGQDFFMVMEYLDGTPFNRLLSKAKSTPAPPGVLLKIIAEALLGLHYAHELHNYDGQPLNIVHRDVSPHNIFVTFDGHTKVLDFGIAKAASHMVQTAAGMVKGKIGYMSPEQVRLEKVDRRADVFAMGLVLAEALTCKRFWDGMPDLEILDQLNSGNIERLEQIKKLLPGGQLEKIVEKSLASKPDDRYPSAAAMGADIEDYLRSSKIRVTSEDISKFVHQLFGEKRAQMRKLIERQIAKLRDENDGPTSVDSRAPVSLRSGLPRIGLEMTTRIDRAALVGEIESSASAAASPNSNETRSLVASQTVSDMPAQRPMTFYALLAVGCIVAGVGTFFILGRRQDAINNGQATPQTVQTPASNAAPSATALPTIAPTPAPTPAPAPAASSSAGGAQAMMELQITAVPTTATIFVDGSRIPTNPYSGKVPLDGMGHRVHAEAKGYKAAGEIVLFSKDTSITLQLTPLNGAAATPDGKTPTNNTRKLDDNPYP
jgi:eukaryotic-like serine/threonine-protein kinase